MQDPQASRRFLERRRKNNKKLNNSLLFLVKQLHSKWIYTGCADVFIVWLSCFLWSAASHAENSRQISKKTILKQNTAYKNCLRSRNKARISKSDMRHAIYYS